jgi:hypothetical protein
MYVRKIRGQNKVSKITLTASEVALVHKIGISVELYVKRRLRQIAKERKWTWYFNKEKA